MLEGFKKLIAWQKSYKLALEIYKITKNFPKSEQYALTSQIRRAAISVSANIAEGYERQHRKEYIQFLTVSKGSLGELETYLLLAKDLDYVNAEIYKDIYGLHQESTKLINGLIKSLRL